MTDTITLLLHSAAIQSADYVSKEHRAKIIAFWYACYGERTVYIIRPKIRAVRGKYGIQYINQTI